MRWSLCFLFWGFLSLVRGLSSSGNRLLVVIEEAAQQTKYSQFWSDLKGASGSVETLATYLRIANFSRCARTGLFVIFRVSEE